MKATIKSIKSKLRFVLKYKQYRLNGLHDGPVCYFVVSRTRIKTNRTFVQRLRGQSARCCYVRNVYTSAATCNAAYSVNAALKYVELLSLAQQRRAARAAYV